MQQRFTFGFITILVIVIATYLLFGHTFSTVAVMVTIDPHIQWTDQPLTNLAGIITPIYAPAQRPKDLLLSEVLWQPRRAEIPRNLSLTNDIQNDDSWHLQTIYGTAPNQLWIYISQDINKLPNVVDALQKYKASAKNIELVIDGKYSISTTILKSNDQQAHAVDFSINSVDIVAIWNHHSVSEIREVLNSLTLLTPQQPLTKELERELSISAYPNQ